MAVLKVVVLVLLTRLLTPADFGVVGAALVVISFSLNFSQLGLGPAVVQRPVLEARHISTAFFASFAFGCWLGRDLAGGAPHRAVLPNGSARPGGSLARADLSYCRPCYSFPTACLPAHFVFVSSPTATLWPMAWATGWSAWRSRSSVGGCGRWSRRSSPRMRFVRPSSCVPPLPS